MKEVRETSSSSYGAFSIHSIQAGIECAFDDKTRCAPVLGYPERLALKSSFSLVGVGIAWLELPQAENRELDEDVSLFMERIDEYRLR